VLADPTAVWTVDPAQLEGRGKAPAWHDRELTGRVVHVFSRGQQIVNDGFPLFRPGRGRPV
jgi:dihydroorotase-like cyclic amidohydrolase